MRQARSLVNQRSRNRFSRLSVRHGAPRWSAREHRAWADLGATQPTATRPYRPVQAHSPWSPRCRDIKLRSRTPAAPRCREGCWPSNGLASLIPRNLDRQITSSATIGTGTSSNAIGENRPNYSTGQGADCPGIPSLLLSVRVRCADAECTCNLPPGAENRLS